MTCTGCPEKQNRMSCPTDFLTLLIAIRNGFVNKNCYFKSHL